MISHLHLPALLPRTEMLSLLQEKVYGYLPPRPADIKFEVRKNIRPNFCAGKATCDQVRAICTIGDAIFSFPFLATLPTDGEKHPFFIHVKFTDGDSDRYQPTEELVDNGFAVFSFDYQDVTTDDANMRNGLAGVLYPNGVRKSPTDAGKIAMWAWAMHRVMDYARTLGDRLDLTTAVACGHSRLGKTALLAAATDERFTFAYSNNSGCSGAAISRQKAGETIQNICTRFPYWFCENYQQYKCNEKAMPFDQHYLVASMAPRRVLIGSASDDLWAGPLSEQQSCFAAAPAFVNGFVCPNRPAKVGEKFYDGDIGYHLRKGPHYFSREDWNNLIQFIRQHS